jgi:hypothetical protein
MLCKTRALFSCASRAIAAVGVLACSTAALADVYQLDRLSIERNGALILDENFDDGQAPPSGPLFVGSTTPAYAPGRVVGNFAGSESGGKLALDPANRGIATVNPFTGQPEGIMFQAAYLNVNTQETPETLLRGLKINHTFQVSGLFDLTTPTLANRRDNFGLRLADFDNSGPSGWNDVLDLQVFKSVSTGAPVLLMTQRNFHDNSRFTINTVFLDPAAGDQVELSFVKGVAGDAHVFGSYRYFQGGVAVGAAQLLATPAELFHGETFTRPGFFAVAALPVPEPSAWALMAAGLAGLGARARSRSRRSLA